MKENELIQLADGRMLGYAEYGLAEGFPVLFFHGSPGSSHVHQDLAKTAAQNDVRLIAVDRPGYGLSDTKSDRTLLSCADDINVLTNSLGVKIFSIIGFSGGSPYPIACACKFPDRIKKIALVSTLAPLSAPDVKVGMSPMAKGLYDLAQANPAELRTAFAAVAPNENALFAAMSASAGSWDQKVLLERAAEFELEFAHTLKKGIEGIASDFVLNSGSWGFPINECKTEVHLFSGSIDQNTPPAMTHYLSAQLPNSHVHQFHDEGHYILYPHWGEILACVK